MRQASGDGNRQTDCERRDDKQDQIRDDVAAVVADHPGATIVIASDDKTQASDAPKMKGSAGRTERSESPRP